MSDFSPHFVLFLAILQLKPIVFPFKPLILTYIMRYVCRYVRFTHFTYVILNPSKFSQKMCACVCVITFASLIS